MSEPGITGKAKGAAAQAPGGVAQAASPRTEARPRLSQALWVAALAMAAGAAFAQPLMADRMNPDERERFRRELRQQSEQGRRDDAPGLRRERMSPRERDQLRQQLREMRPEQRRGQGRGRS